MRSNHRLSVTVAVVAALVAGSCGSDNPTAETATRTGDEQRLPPSATPAEPLNISLDDPVLHLDTSGDGFVYAVTQQAGEAQVLVEIDEQAETITRTADLVADSRIETRHMTVTDDSVWVTYPETLTNEFQVTNTVGAIGRVSRQGQTLTITAADPINEAGVHTITNDRTNVWLAGKSPDGGSQVLRYDPDQRTAVDITETAADGTGDTPIVIAGNTAIAGSGTGNLAAVDLTTGQLQATIPLSGTPTRLAATSDTAWALTYGTGGDTDMLVELDITTLTISATYPAPIDTNLADIALTGDGIYISSTDADIYTPDPESGALTQIADLPGDSQNITAGQAGLWVATSDSGQHGITRLDWARLAAQ